MKNILIAGASVSLLICGTLLLALSADASPADKCLQFHQARSPAVLKLANIEQKSHGLWIVVEAGADRTLSRAVCKFNADGEVDSTGTEVAWTSSLIDGVVSCLDRSNENWDDRLGKYKQKQENCGEAAVSRRSGWLRIFADGDLERTFGRK